MSFSWACPYCNQHTTITNKKFSHKYHRFDMDNKDGYLSLGTEVIVCPNDNCQEYTIQALLYRYAPDGVGHYEEIDPAILEWQLKPSSHALQFPSFVPKAIITDYEEACLIRDLSPKASATLSRRCLQGIIRDFWDVKKGRLVDEINAIKDLVDPI